MVESEVQSNSKSRLILALDGISEKEKTKRKYFLQNIYKHEGVYWVEQKDLISITRFNSPLGVSNFLSKHGIVSYNSPFKRQGRPAKAYRIKDIVPHIERMK